MKCVLCSDYYGSYRSEDDPGICDNCEERGLEENFKTLIEIVGELKKEIEDLKESM